MEPSSTVARHAAAAGEAGAAAGPGPGRTGSHTRTLWSAEAVATIRPPSSSPEAVKRGLVKCGVGVRGSSEGGAGSTFGRRVVKLACGQTWSPCGQPCARERGGREVRLSQAWEDV